MPINTDLSTAPYYDDFKQEKDYYKILFRPSVAVQARELNQLQTILQNQIEKFGDNIFRKGTIIDGCDIKFHDVFPYVKIKDVETSGSPVNVSQYKNYYIKNSANLQALVVETISGYESRNPDLNTLYVRYLNSGSDSNTTTFSENQVLTVYDADYILEKINVTDGSSGFSNTDTLYVISALAIQNTTGGVSFANGFNVGDIINNTIYANGEILEVNTTANSETLILKIKPLANDLSIANSQLWTFSTNDTIISDNTSPETATIVGIVGQGGGGSIVTNGIGQLSYVSVTSKGSGYYVDPTVVVSSTIANTTQISQLDLTPQTYLTQITIANSLTIPVGTGYGMTVSNGVIYQKGYFSRVSEQLVVVEKYSNEPDSKCVGFDTTEEIINSNIDTSLLDNSIGTPNATAPGANRLKLTPTLVVLDKNIAEANADFLSVAEFSQGLPYKQNRQTQYNIIGKEIAKRTYEESGNYVLNQFILTTKSDSDFTDEASTFDIVIDPGVAYINGNRVETNYNYTKSVNKGTNTYISNTASVSLNYGNYIIVNELGGIFNFAIGDIVNLYSDAKTYLTSSFGSAITSPTTLIGTARIRSLVHDNGIVGTPSATYRMYLFDISMNSGQNFKNVKSVYYNGTSKGVADIVLVTDPTTGSSIATLYDNNHNSMVFYAGIDAMKNANNISYTYRTIDSSSYTIGTSGNVTITTGASEYFPYTGNLSTLSKREILVIPLANAQYSVNISGSMTTTSTSQNVSGTSTLYLTELNVGDHIKINGSVIGRVQSITNNTLLTLSSNASSSTSGNAVVYFPQNVPISFESTSRIINVASNGTSMTISLGNTLASSVSTAIAYNVKVANASSVAKTVNRNNYVRLRLANNVTTNTGPWSIGVSDVFRLNGVYLGTNNTFVPTDSGITNVTNDFYIDHNQNEDFYNTSYLYKKPKSTLNLTTSDCLLIDCDVFTTSSEGMKSLLSYPINDGVVLSSSNTTINTLEIPEMYGLKDQYYDLRDQFDFRPISNNTATLTSNAALATINPEEPSSANRFSTSNKKFPVPNSQLTGTIEYYLGRTDRVVVDENGSFNVIEGVSGSNEPPIQPTNSLTINTLEIPPYPSLPFSLSANIVNFADTKIANEKYSYKRIQKYKVNTPVDATQRNILQPKRYTMEEIGDLEKRIQDLEYYVSFTLAEALVKNKVITSSIDSSVDRFKFGFFVDTFSDTSYSDTSNPEYYASVIDGNLVPKVEEFNLEFQFNNANLTTLSSISGNVATFPFDEYTLISQLKATDGPVIIANTTNNTTNNTTSNTSSNTNTSNTSVVNTVISTTTTRIDAINRTTSRSDSGTVYEDWYYTMSSTGGPVELYMNCTDNNIAIEVFQGSEVQVTNGTSVKTSATAVAVTSVEASVGGKAYLIGGRSRIESVGSLNRKSYGPVGHFIEDSFAVKWTHNPNNGIYYKIRIYKGERHGNDASKGTYAYRLYYPTDVYTVTSSANTSLPSTFKHVGTVVSVSPSQFTIQSSVDYIYFNSISIPYMHVVDSQKFTISVSGLKPTTVHKFYFDNVDNSSKCKQESKSLGSSLITDSSGTLNFDFYYDAGITEVTSDFQKANKLASSIAGVKTFTIKSSDSTSIANGSILVKNYVSNTINSSTTTTVSSTNINVKSYLK